MSPIPGTPQVVGLDGHNGAAVELHVVPTFAVVEADGHALLPVELRLRADAFDGDALADERRHVMGWCVQSGGVGDVQRQQRRLRRPLVVPWPAQLAPIHV